MGAAREDFTALVLDVSKGHRRIKLRPQDQGLLRFRRRGKLFQCLTLNFGARASSYYWARTAGLLCRLLRRIIYVNHGLMIYVDDLLCLLRKCASPLLAALLVVFLLVLKVPMSWHKASLSSHPVWIGWRHLPSAWKQTSSNGCFNYCCPSWKAGMSPDMMLSASIRSALLSVSNPGPTLLHSGQLVMAALTPDQWEALQPLLNADLLVKAPLATFLFLWVPHWSAWHACQSRNSDIPAWLPESRRIWVEVSRRHIPHRFWSRS